ncbi:MAG: type II toxin-antitoxin system RelE/ParE family toxin [Flavobacteriaceae bacterium]|nr:type II toxin-antitoxin system RelE/ParE family toxin [Flavobacteriaceae bacterium]
MVKKKIVWDTKAYLQLEKEHKHIKKSSVIAANKVRESIRDATKELALHPEKFSLDRFKKNNNGNYRAFERYRVTYKVKEAEIIILRVRHTSREPLEY